jgi:glutathione-specific gamma-glutamylcyclotransferase
LEYAHRTHEELRRHNIRDRALERLLQLARAGRDHDKPQ